jgi:putative nucleotidyltransferase with HDIG domain
MLDSNELCEVVGRVGSLPPRPTIYAALTQELLDPRRSLASIAALVEQDIAITAKLLQVVNSAFVGVPQRTTSVSRAISYIGIEMVRDLVLSSEMFQELGRARDHIDLDGEFRHAMLTASLARELCEQPELADDAFIAGILHDIGKLIMATQMTTEFAAISAECLASGRPRHEVECERYRVSHAEVGAYLLGARGMPYHVVDAVAWHHKPRVSSTGTLDVAGAVYVANRLAETFRQGGLEPGDLDAAWLASVGGDHRLAEWRDIAATIDPESS